MKLQRNRFEVMVQDVTSKNEKWLENEFKAILENNKPYQTKCDYIGYSILSIDKKIEVIEEEIKSLKEYKLKLQSAKKIATEVGAKVFKEYGVSKIEGGGISSITLTKQVTATKLHINAIDEEEFIKQGFYKKVLDKDKVMIAYQDGEYLDFINKHATIVELESITPSRLRINKRIKVDIPDIDAA